MKEHDRMKEHLLDWLRDAHAMEEQAETMLRNTAARLEHYPEFKQRIEQHLLASQGQARQLAECIDRLGGSTSTMKDMGGKLMASMQNFTGMFASDEVVKAAIFSSSFSHLEIASYTSLVAAARQCGDQHIAQVCESILQEELAMAEWLDVYIPKLTHLFLAKVGLDEPAKR